MFTIISSPDEYFSIIPSIHRFSFLALPIIIGLGVAIPLLPTGQYNLMIAVLGSGDGGQISVLDVIIVMIDLLVGLFAIFLESNLPSFVQTVRSTITHKAPILGHVTWRGGVYTISGLLNLTIIDPLHIVVGLFSTAVGVCMINVGRKAAEHLAKLRASITDENAFMIIMEMDTCNKMNSTLSILIRYGFG